MCACVFEIQVLLKIFVERCFWELKNVTWIIGWVAYLIAFMSVFFSSRKSILRSWLDTSSIASYLSSFLSFFLSQSRQHLDTWWIDWESFWPLDSFLTPGGSIKPHILLLVFLFLNSFSTHDLSTLLFSTPTRHLICRDLLRALFNLLVRSTCHFLDLSLDWFLFSLPNTLFSPSNRLVSSSFTKLFFTW